MSDIHEDDRNMGPFPVDHERAGLTHEAASKLLMALETWDQEWKSQLTTTEWFAIMHKMLTTRIANMLRLLLLTERRT